MTTALSSRALECDYGQGPVLYDVNLEITQGEIVGIVGPSGCGKSTLLRAFAGILPPAAGSLSVFGEELTAATVRRFVSFVPQTSSVNSAVPMTATEAVMLGLAGRSARRPTFSRLERRQALDLLDRLELTGLAHRQVHELSGGQLQRILIARALITQPRILLMDEPTSGLDLRRLREVLSLTKELRRVGTTIVLTTHDLNWVAAQLPRVVFLDGTVVADGRPGEIINTALIDKVYGAPAQVLRDGRGNVLVLAQLAHRKRRTDLQDNPTERPTTEADL